MKPWRGILRGRWSELASAMCSSCRTTCSSATASAASRSTWPGSIPAACKATIPAAHASSMLEMLGVPYVGHDPLAATTLDNKHAFKREAVCAGIPTAAFSTWNMAHGPFRPELNSRFRSAFGDYAGPFIVKPVSGRASLHVHVAEDRAALPDMVEAVYRATENVVLIEKYLSGREFCIGVAGPVTSRQRQLVRGGEPFTLSAIERAFDAGRKDLHLDGYPADHARPVQEAGPGARRRVAGAHAPPRMRDLPGVQPEFAHSPGFAQRRARQPARPRGQSQARPQATHGKRHQPDLRGAFRVRDGL